RPVVDLDRLTPGDLVVTRVGARPPVLDDDPAVVGEDALPAPRARGIDVHQRLAPGTRRRKEASARPVGLVPGLGLVGGEPPGRVHGERRDEGGEEGEGGKAQGVHGAWEMARDCAGIKAPRSVTSLPQGRSRPPPAPPATARVWPCRAAGW